MEKIICKECGKEFEYEKLTYCKAQLTVHLKNEHNMSIKDYTVKHEYNGVVPLCPCGCGKEVAFGKGGFQKYHSDTCYGNLVRKGNAQILNQYRNINKNSFDIVKYYESHYDRNTYQEAFDMFNSKTMSLGDVAKSYNIDKRTLKRVWLALKIVTPEKLKELLDFTKYQLSTQNCSTNVTNNDDLMSWCYNLIKTFPYKYTANSLRSEYNKTHPNNQVAHNGNIIVQGLYRIYGDEIDLYLPDGYHSSEEYKFYEILKFYIDEYRVKLGKRFYTDDSYIIYDICIGSRLLIEYDSDNQYHNSEKIKEKDKFKEDYAKENGYIFLRLTKNDIKDINTVTKIKELLNNIDNNEISSDTEN